MKHIIIVEAAKTGTGFYIIDSALNLGFTVTFHCKSIEKYQDIGIQMYIDRGLEILEVDTSNDHTLIAKLTGEFAGKSPDGIICFTE
ncbi:hypothetical protein BH10PSE19_BH10PSE19_08550 [soil metagenome]